jgi:hypothetical protein
MDGKLFTKYANKPQHADVMRITERGQLMEYFCNKINPGRVGVRFNGRFLQPITMPRMGKILEQIPTKDLYYLKRICEDSPVFSKRFFWELNPKNHGNLVSDLANGER